VVGELRAVGYVKIAMSTTAADAPVVRGRCEGRH
jgi:hypothetical protein